MELGTGIFLSAALIALVLLYGFTKDRWRWRHILGRLMLVCVVLAVGITAVIVAVQYWDDVFPTRLSRQNEYAGLRLGMSQDEVMYVKGYPPVVLSNDEKEDGPWKGFFNVIETKNLPKGKRAQDYLNWSYSFSDGNINVAFDEKRNVSAVQCYSKDKIYRCPAIGGIKDGNSEKDVLRKFGKPTASQLQGVTKAITYGDLGVKLTLEKEEVYMLEVSAPGFVRR